MKINRYACLSFMLLSFACSAKESPNIIYLIGDGMGVSYTSAYRLFADNPTTKVIEPTVFDQLLVGSATTYPDDDSENVTDSAAAATALASKIKTFNGAIGVDKQRQPVTTLLELAKEKGYSTGIAVTSQINHATPAAFVAHADSRLSYDDIANQYVDSTINGKPKVDLMLGGGRNYFIRKDRNLIAELKQKNYSYVDDFNKLGELEKLPAIGLFANVGMPAALGSDHPFRLADMTDRALSILSGKSPFFLMLEASQIDWCGHANDIACAMAEMRDMAEAMARIKVFIDKHPNTLLVVTADHSTGGLSIGAKDEYVWRPQVVGNIAVMPAEVSELLVSDVANWQTVWTAKTKITLLQDELASLDNLVRQAEANRTDEAKKRLTTQILKIIDKRSGTGWTTKGHTGEDVQVFAYGKQAAIFAGSQDNTDIARKLFDLVK